ncbi:hypothetical protein C0J52_04735 [Blattella germanica]|nr:hypothetical protein C0J52_04735 [Blattella germanica]
MKYLQPLKSPENAGLVDAALVDEIFYQVPAILAHHEVFLEELRKRLEHWDVKQKVGDIFLETFTKPSVVETYALFLNNWKTAKEAIKNTCQAKPAFARFLEALLKHTDPAHPDHQLLMEAQKEIHDLAMKINCTERETLKELEALIEGLINLVAPERTFIRHDLVTMVSGQGTRKERALFLFSDLLVITSIKRRSGTIRKPSTTTPGSVASTLEANKYKLLMRIPLDDLEVVKGGGWNTTDPYTVSVGTVATPVTRMLPIAGKLWCGCHNSIKILNTSSLEVEVGCDDIIRQHKAACLRVTSILACKDLLWIGTSAGVILTMPLPHITPATTKLSNVPNATGVPHGHTGHVRFLTYVETVPAQNNEGLMIRPSTHHRYSLKSKPELQSSSNTNVKLLVISGGDGYEDFRTSSVSEVAGREDSTNHLLLWHV